MAHGRVVVPVKAMQGETVEVQWRLRNGGTHRQRVTCPPGIVVAAREQAPAVPGAAEAATPLPAVPAPHQEAPDAPVAGGVLPGVPPDGGGAGPQEEA